MTARRHQDPRVPREQQKVTEYGKVLRRYLYSKSVPDLTRYMSRLLSVGSDQEYNLCVLLEMKPDAFTPGMSPSSFYFNIYLLIASHPPTP